LPTEEECIAERDSWSSNNAAGAFASPLKWTVGGNRHPNDGGSLNYVGDIGYYWSSTVNGTYSTVFFFYSDQDSAGTHNESSRAFGFAVRCIKDY
jgi:hypothetical protein